MRKITSLVLCILMLATLAVPAMAADVPTFVLTADMEEVVTGDIVTITVSVADGNTAKCSNFGVIIDYKTEKFELVEVDNYYDDNGKVAGMGTGILADPLTGENDAPSIFAGKLPGVGAWNTKPVSGGTPGQTDVAPSGKVGYVKLKCIADTTATGVVDTSEDITATASVNVNGADKPVASTVTPVAVKFVESKGLLGDADGNGFVNVGDSLLIQKYQMGDITESDLNLSVCDVDGNGFYNVGDSLLIQKYQMGDIDKFPVEEK